ncbi:lambda exonuclease family protein [Pararobbsia silviterrae]|uniref:Exonuclease n=1 Tax=Pararobbsia silviterrae TaxID=1792498 RepID=A0A494Y0V8_9BURK|nr:lambda exonuclease family protein [Pararobbsia silviterrae]RKP56392.1 exonuclease [Pararobbsia silviterrae]
MILVEAQQGTPEWLQARSGATTASRFADAISVLTRTSGSKKAGDPTKESDKYAIELAIEIISGEPYGEPIKAWTLDRGHELEWRARAAYEMQTGKLVRESGIVLTDDRRFGYSTDGLLDDGDGAIEIKCPVDTVKIMEMIETGDTSEYDHQLQGGLWLTNRKYIDFIMYVPALEKAGRDLYVKRIERNDDFIESMIEKLNAFNARVDRYVSTLRKAA